jgi:hypothetical protein
MPRISAKKWRDAAMGCAELRDGGWGRSGSSCPGEAEEGARADHGHGRQQADQARLSAGRPHGQGAAGRPRPLCCQAPPAIRRRCQQLGTIMATLRLLDHTKPFVLAAKLHAGVRDGTLKSSVGTLLWECVPQESLLLRRHLQTRGLGSSFGCSAAGAERMCSSIENSGGVLALQSLSLLKDETSQDAPCSPRHDM